MDDKKIYFIIEHENYDEHYGFAFSQSDISPDRIQNWNIHEEWKTIQFELKLGDYADYMINDLNIPLFSEKFKKVILNTCINKEHLLFYPVYIFNGLENRIYYFLKLTVLKDIIDVDKSIIENDTIMRPYFITEKIENIFRCDCDPSYLFITEYLMNAIQRENITGINYYTWS